MTEPITPRCRWCHWTRDSRRSICDRCLGWQRRARATTAWTWCVYMETGSGNGSLVLEVDDGEITQVLRYEPSLHIFRPTHDEHDIQQFGDALPDLGSVTTLAMIERVVLPAAVGVDSDRVSVYMDDVDMWWLKMPRGTWQLDGSSCRREALVVALEMVSE